ncbi:hypothetical protein QAD02_012145 [Eretmocerus hayati]|uniref:Uncharacterized protein n=1 Tax=Eretmocerus hayati TaxID=131215 RepID=A0ACC2NYT3_9HYME|nr:hypothetical protein QAD02_012145 [Eretmocerus hayati]
MNRKGMCINRVDIVALLLQNGADPDLGIGPEDVGRPLRMAIRKRNFECVQLLTEHGADMVHVESDPDCLKPIFHQGEVHLIRYLVYDGLKHTLVFDDGSNLLNAATRLGDIGLIEHLLSLGYSKSDINNADISGHTCIFHSVIRGDSVPVQLLINAGADVNLHDVNGIYLLAYAIVTGNRDMSAALIQAGANVEEMDTAFLHCNAAQLALLRGKWEILRLVVQRGNSLHRQNSRRENILDSCWMMLRMRRCTPDTAALIFRYLVDHGASVDTMKDYPSVPTVFFVHSPRSLIDLALRLGLRPIAREMDIFYQTPLREAYLNRDIGLIKHLVQVHKIDINICNNQEESIIFKAARDQSLERLKEFADLGADFNKWNDMDVAPIQYAVFEDQIAEAFKFMMERSNTPTILNVLKYISDTEKIRYEVCVVEYLASKRSWTDNEYIEQVMPEISARCATQYQSCITELTEMSETTIDGVALLTILKLDKSSTLGRNNLINYIVANFELQDGYPNFWGDLVENFQKCVQHQATVTKAMRNFGALTNLDIDGDLVIMSMIFDNLTEADLSNLALIE